MQRTVYSPFTVIVKAVVIALNAHCIACVQSEQAQEMTDVTALICRITVSICVCFTVISLQINSNSVIFTVVCWCLGSQSALRH